MVLTSNDKGNIAEAAITLEAIKLGIDVLKPVAEHGRYDLVLGSEIACSECSANGALYKRELGIITRPGWWIAAHAQWVSPDYVLCP